MSEEKDSNKIESGQQTENSEAYVLSDEEVHHLLNHVKVNHASDAFCQNRHWPKSTRQQNSETGTLLEEMAMRLAASLSKKDAGEVSNEYNTGEVLVFPDITSLENYLNDQTLDGANYSRSRVWEKSQIGGDAKIEKMLVDILDEIRMLRNEIKG